MIVDEYEKCIRGMQDKIDEQNTTINSLIDQIDLAKSISLRVDPDGQARNSFCTFGQLMLLNASRIL